VNEKKMTNDVVMDGEAKLRQDRRPSIKLKGDPHIVVALPVGPTNLKAIFTCPEEGGGCGSKWEDARQFTVPAVLPVHFLMSHMNLITPLNTTMTYLVEWGRLSAEARQIMTKQAIRLNAKYILYWDIDTLPPQLGLYTLHNFMERNPDVGAISGIYTTRENPNEPLLYTAHGEGAAWDFPMGPQAEPQPIFGAGAGFLLARVDAIKDVMAKEAEANGGVEVPMWADERTMDSGEGNARKITWGHDVRFCYLLNKNGWPVYGDGRVLCDHVDIGSNTVHSVPHDAPGLVSQQRKNINTEGYWNAVYGSEGADSWRKYPEMFNKVVEQIHSGTRVVELGCGVGILGSKLTAEKGVTYSGFDISQVGVEAAKARFLNVAQLDVARLEQEHLVGAVHVVATEMMEHLDEFVFHKVVKEVTDCPSVESFIFTVPDNCMGPDEVPEHTALFNEQLVRERTARYEGWDLEVQQADDHHLICILRRG
jgi:hypothetical protein